MTKTILLLLILGLIQCTVKKPSGQSKSALAKSIVENKELNVVYRGVRNLVTINMLNTDSIKVHGPGVHKVNENEYRIVPGKGLKMEVTIIGYLDGKEIIEKREFRIINIQKTYASIHNYFGYAMLSKEELIDSKVKIHIPQFVYELPNVDRFEYKINDQSAALNIGDTFNLVARDQIKSLKVGDSILIDKVKLTNEDPQICKGKIHELKIYIN